MGCCAAILTRIHNLTSRGYELQPILNVMLANCIKRSEVLNGRYWIRTSDPFRVKEVRYHCANRPRALIARAQRL